jgi:HAD superfamily hydrolase (TIGR01509 family)
MLKFNGLPTMEKLKILNKLGKISKSQFDKIWSLKQKYTVEVISDLAKKDHQKIEMYRQLEKENIISACVTNSIRETAEMMLSKTGQIEFLKFIITNEDVINSKPHSEPYIRAMISLGSMPEETLIVEDSDKGFQSANGTGAKVLRVSNSSDVTWKKINDIISHK